MTEFTNYYNRIKSLAGQRKMSVREVERRIHMANGSIGKWKVSDPSVTNLIACALALHTSVAFLVGETDNPDYVFTKSDQSINTNVQQQPDDKSKMCCTSQV